jgi:hypothetical protein
MREILIRGDLSPLGGRGEGKRPSPVQRFQGTSYPNGPDSIRTNPACQQGRVSTNHWDFSVRPIFSARAAKPWLGKTAPGSGRAPNSLQDRTGSNRIRLLRQGRVPVRGFGMGTWFGWLVVAVAGGWRRGLVHILLAVLGGFLTMGFIGHSVVLILRETVMAGIMANTIWFHNSPFVLVSSLF